jgi:hypothetical protein
VNDGVKKDRDTGVGQIIATTSISNFKYLLAKSLSNFFVLLTIASIIILMAFSIVMIRGSNYPVHFSQFILPYLLVTIPSIFFVSVLAIFMEVVFGKYVILQNVSFFFLFPILIGILNLNSKPQVFWFDVLGTKYLSNEMSSMVNSRFHASVNTISTGYLFGDKSMIKYFLFEGVNWSFGYVVSRILWIGIAFILLSVSARIFNRFDKNEIPVRSLQKNIAIEIKTPIILREIHLSLLPVATPAFGIWPFIKTELLMLFRIGPKWFWIINISTFIALFFVPLNTAHQMGLPIFWFLQTNRWADIATKEKINHTHYFTYSAYQPLKRLLTAQIIAGIILSVLLALPVIIRYSVNGDLSSVINIIVGAVFIVALSVSSGVITGGKRFFEIIFFMLTYINISALSLLDYFGAFKHELLFPLVEIVFIGLMFFCAYMYRSYEIRNV